MDLQLEKAFQRGAGGGVRPPARAAAVADPAG